MKEKAQEVGSSHATYLADTQSSIGTSMILFLLSAVNQCTITLKRIFCSNSVPTKGTQTVGAFTIEVKEIDRDGSPDHRLWIPSLVLRLNRGGRKGALKGPSSSISGHAPLHEKLSREIVDFQR